MKVVVSSTGPGLQAATSPTFGRCPVYVFVDTETMQAETLDNGAANAPGGAGIQAAQFVLEQGAQSVISGRVGPNAIDVLNAAQVPVYAFNGGTVQQAVEAFKAGQLQQATAGPMGRSGGRGTGRGSGRGMGRSAGMGMAGPQAAAPAAPPAGDPSNEVEALKEELAGLRQQLAAVLDKLDQMKKE